MPLLRYGSKGYPATIGPGYRKKLPKDYYVDWSAVVYSALTVGRANRFHVVRHGVYSYWELLYRAAIIYANLKSDNDDANLLKTTAFTRLDPSEKSAISYFLGLTCAKLFSSDFIRTPWLMHLDVYDDKYPVELWKGKKRPDLIGLDLKRRWAVLEAKGRTGSFDSEAFKDAKKQTRNIKKIEGMYPALRVASEAYFSGEKLALKAEDPPDFDEDAPDLDISSVQFLSDYYRPLIDLLNYDGLSSRIENYGAVNFTVVDIVETDFRVGVATDVVDLIKNQRFESLYDYALNFQRIRTVPARTTIGLDGILVRLGDGWNSEQMSLEPAERS